MNYMNQINYTTEFIYSIKATTTENLKNWNSPKRIQDEKKAILFILSQ